MGSAIRSTATTRSTTSEFETGVSANSFGGRTDNDRGRVGLRVSYLTLNISLRYRLSFFADFPDVNLGIVRKEFLRRRGVRMR